MGGDEVAPLRARNVVAVCLAAAGLAAGGFAYLRFQSEGTDRSLVRFEAPEPDTVPPPLPPPGTRDSLIALVAAPEDVMVRYETRETDYESKAIAVYGRRGQFYLAGLPDGGRAWLRERDAGAAHPIEQLLINRLTYLTPSWDMRVRDEAAATAPSRAVMIPRTQEAEYPARVLEFVHRPDGLWINVEIFNASPCDGDTPKTVTTGWVPLYAADAKTTVWFHSRGC